MRNLHVGAWSVWLAAALSCAMLARTPLFIILLLFVTGILYDLVKSRTPEQKGWLIFIKMGILFAGIATFLNMLVVHDGSTVLLRLPAIDITQAIGNQSLPIKLQIGGKITLEALAYGLNNGLSLVAILLIIGVFNLAVDHYQLLRYVPASMYQTGIIATIALTFVPNMVIAAQEISEAQAIRGHRIKRIKDIMPVFTALVTESLERSINLAESMESRGFGHSPSIKYEGRWLFWKMAMISSLLLILGGAFWFSYGNGDWRGITIAILGIGLMIFIIISMGHLLQRSRYRRNSWRRTDKILGLSSALSLILLIYSWIFNKAGMTFYPYPRFSVPAFDPVVGLAIMFLMTPAMVRLNLEKSNDHSGAPFV